MRIIAKYTKGDSVRFISHLDVQRLFQRAFRRAELPLSYSQGFNPHPLLSFAAALAVGWTSECEYLDVILENDMSTAEFISRMNRALPEGVRVTEAMDAAGSKSSLTTLMRSAVYEVELILDDEFDGIAAEKTIRDMLNGPIAVLKKTKGGMKTVDIRPYVLSMQLNSTQGRTAELLVEGTLTAAGGLPVELLLNELQAKIGRINGWRINRSSIKMDWTELK